MAELPLRAARFAFCGNVHERIPNTNNLQKLPQRAVRDEMTGGIRVETETSSELQLIRGGFFNNVEWEGSLGAEVVKRMRLKSLLTFKGRRHYVISVHVLNR